MSILGGKESQWFFSQENVSKKKKSGNISVYWSAVVPRVEQTCRYISMTAPTLQSSCETVEPQGLYLYFILSKWTLQFTVQWMGKTYWFIFFKENIPWVSFSRKAFLYKIRGSDDFFLAGDILKAASNNVSLSAVIKGRQIEVWTLPCWHSSAPVWENTQPWFQFLLL